MGLGFAQTDLCKKNIKKYIEKTLSQSLPYQVSIGSISGFFPLDMYMEDIFLKSNEGGIRIQSIQCSLSPIYLLQKHLVLDRLSIYGLHNCLKTSQNPLQIPSIQVKDIPWNLSVRKLRIQTEEKKDFFLSFKLHAQAPHVHATLCIDKTPFTFLPLKIQAFFNSNKNYLSLQLDAFHKQKASQIKARIISGDFLEKWNKILANETNPDICIEGKAALQLVDKQSQHLIEAKSTLTAQSFELHHFLSQGKFKIEGSFCLERDGLFKNSTIVTHLEDVSLLNNYLPWHISGSIDSKIDVKGSLAQPQIQASIQSSNNFYIQNHLQRKFYSQVHLSKKALKVHTNNLNLKHIALESLDFEYCATSPKSPFSLHADGFVKKILGNSKNFQFQSQGTVEKQSSGEIVVCVEGLTGFAFHNNLNLTQPFWICSNWKKTQISPFIFQLPAGKISASKTTIDHSMQNSQGYFYIEGASFEYPDTNLSFHQVCASLELFQNTLKLKNLQAQDKHEGKVFAKGEVSLKEDFDFDVNLDIQNVHLYDTDQTQAQFTGQLNLKGNAEKALLKGTLSSDKVESKLSKVSNIDIPEIPIRFCNQERLEGLFLEEAFFELNLNIELIISQNASLSGRGLKSLWQGDLLLRGNLNHPELRGSLSIAEGSYDFAGRSLEITKGSIVFDPQNVEKNNLDITARIHDELSPITLQMQGSLSHLKIQIAAFSPQDLYTTLSKALFNKNPEEISTFETLQIGRIFWQISNNSAPDILGQINEKTLNIDHFDIQKNNGESDNLTFRVGKSFSFLGGFLVSFEHAENKQNKVQLEFNISPQLKMITEAPLGSENTQEQSGKLSLKWKQDY